MNVSILLVSTCIHFTESCLVCYTHVHSQTHVYINIPCNCPTKWVVLSWFYIVPYSAKTTE